MLKIIAVLTTFIIMFQGCSGINTVKSEGSSTYTKTGDFFLDNQISVQDIKISETGGIKNVNVDLLNAMWFDMSLEVKMDFYDGDGVAIDNPWGWKPVSVERKQDTWVKFTAPSAQAVNFKLYIKKADINK